MPVGPDRVARRLADRAGDGAVFDRPPVDEYVLEAARGKRDRPPGHEPENFERARSRLEGLDLAQRLTAEELEDPRGPVDGRRQVEGLAGARPEGERDGRVREGRPRDGRGRGAPLRL